MGLSPAPRAVHIAGITPNPDGEFMARAARNLTAIDPDFLDGIRYLIHDLDSSSPRSSRFKAILEDAGVTPVSICYP